MYRFLLLALVVWLPVTFAASESKRETLVIANSKAWKPFSFINQKGEPDGILVDYWREYSRVTGTPVRFLLLDWEESLQAVNDGRADVHSGLLWSLSRDEFLDYSQPIMTIDTQLFVSRDLLNVDMVELLSGKHPFLLGVVQGGFEHSFVKRNYPQINTVAYSNNAEMISAAFDGDIDAFVADLQVANFYFSTTQGTHQFSGVQHLYSGVLRPAVAEGNNALLLQLARGIAKINTEAKHRIFSRWMYIETVYPNYLVPTLSALAIIAIFSYLVLLRMTVRAKTRELELANRELKHLSETDQLTGLGNRYHFYSQFTQRVTRANTVCVMLLDIDDFKQINDTYGHQVGDAVIQAVGAKIKHIVEKHHLTGRIGGEEFAVVCSDFTVEQAKRLADTLCDSIRRLVIFDDGSKVTISLGCAYYLRSNQEISLSHADNLMYQAKANGKDQWNFKLIDGVPANSTTPKSDSINSREIS